MKTINHEERNQRRHQKMERTSMLMDQYKQHSETKSNLHGQCNPIQNSNDILHRNIKSNHDVHMET
jgi:hypothetical protein